MGFAKVSTINATLFDVKCSLCAFTMIYENLRTIWLCLLPLINSSINVCSKVGILSIDWCKLNSCKTCELLHRYIDFKLNTDNWHSYWQIKLSLCLSIFMFLCQCSVVSCLVWCHTFFFIAAIHLHNPVRIPIK